MLGNGWTVDAIAFVRNMDSREYTEENKMDY